MDISSKTVDIGISQPPFCTLSNSLGLSGFRIYVESALLTGVASSPSRRAAGNFLRANRSVMTRSSGRVRNGWIARRTVFIHASNSRCASEITAPPVSMMRPRTSSKDAPSALAIARNGSSLGRQIHQPWQNELLPLTRIVKWHGERCRKAIGSVEPVRFVTQSNRALLWQIVVDGLATMGAVCRRRLCEGIKDGQPDRWQARLRWRTCASFFPLWPL